MRRLRTILALLAATGLFGSTVGTSLAQSADGPGDDVSQPQPIPLVQRGGLFRGRTVDDAVALAKSSAAQRVGITADQVNVVSVQPTEWPDVSLGCPSPVPTAEFAQVITPGYIILLDAAGTPMTYHTDAGLRAIPCDVPPVSPAQLPDAATD